MSVLRKGDKQEQVKVLQKLLISYGFVCGDVDGIFGGKTNAAVTAFQKNRGLSVDGVVGEKTWCALLKA